MIQSFAITVTTPANTPTGRLIKELLENEVPSMTSLGAKVHNATSASN